MRMIELRRGHRQSDSGQPDQLAASAHARKLATVMAMSLADHLSLADIKNRLSEVVERVGREHGRVVITKHGKPAAVLLSVDELEALEETLEIMSDPELMDQIRRAQVDVEAGRTVPLSREEAQRLITRP